MRDVLILFLHLIVTVVRLAGPGGLRSVVAESLPVKHQLQILNRGRKRAPTCAPRAPQSVWLANCNFASQRACHNITSPRCMLFISKVLVILAKHSFELGPERAGATRWSLAKKFCDYRFTCPVYGLVSSCPLRRPYPEHPPLDNCAENVNFQFNQEGLCPISTKLHF